MTRAPCYFCTGPRDGPQALRVSHAGESRAICRDCLNQDAHEHQERLILEENPLDHEDAVAGLQVRRFVTSAKCDTPGCRYRTNIVRFWRTHKAHCTTPLRQEGGVVP